MADPVHLVLGVIIDPLLWGKWYWGGKNCTLLSYLKFEKQTANRRSIYVKTVSISSKYTLMYKLYFKICSNPCYCHLCEREVMCFFSMTTIVHIRLLRRNMLFMVYNNWHGQQEPQISCQLNTYGTWWSGNFFLQSLPQPFLNYDNGCKMLGTIYRRMTFSTFMMFCLQE